MTSSTATVQAMAAFSPSNAVPAPVMVMVIQWLEPLLPTPQKQYVDIYPGHNQQCSKMEVRLLVERDTLVKVLQISQHVPFLVPTSPK